jgi:hypothetical protein
MSNRAENGTKRGVSATNGVLLESRIRAVVAQCLYGQDSTSYITTPLHTLSTRRYYIAVMMSTCVQLGPSLLRCVVS